MAKDVVKEEKKKEELRLKELGEELATAVAKIGRGMTVLSESRLKGGTIVMLVSKASGVGLNETRKVIDSLKDLEKTYLK